MLDVGAHYGHSLDPFAAQGWTIHAFEPDPANREHLIDRHGDKPNVTVVPKGVADAPGRLPLFTSDASTGVSSFASFTAGHEEAVTVDVTTLSEYLRENEIQAVDFMKVDVEGFEMRVLHGMDWTIKPTTIVLEFENAKTRSLGYGWKDLAAELLGHGYRTIVVSEWAPVVEYGTEHRWLRFADYPTELSDENGWGNLIATRAPRARLDAALASAQRRQRLGRLLHLA